VSERACATTWQTVGPFFSVGMAWLQRDPLAAGATGPRLTIAGRVSDGDGQPVPDALLELWQADAHGRHATGCEGFGRVATDADGRFRFATVKPGATAGPRGTRQAPHVAVALFARGLQRRLVTRVYFPGEPANGSDFALSLVPEARRETLIARARAGEPGVLEWNVVLQGGDETVFFDIY
jgi:protocatechuate 3,4-dioxygenase alpha subunit